MNKGCTVKMFVWASLALSVLSQTGLAAEHPPRQAGIEQPHYIWNEMYPDKLQALQAQGDAARGAIAFEICQGCHRAGALGREDGSYPRLAGQHATTLIKQMADVRSGRRDNPKMYPFAAQHVMGPQDMADMAVYLRGLPVPANNGQGPGVKLDRAKTLYEAHCVACHGEQGQGDAAAFYPKVSGQHYQYLVRELLAIRQGERRNAHPKMVSAIRAYSEQDIRLVADHMSRLSP